MLRDHKAPHMLRKMTRKTDELVDECDELARHARLPAPALSQQAAILEAEGLIGRRRDGRSVFYRLESPQVKPLAKLLYRLFCKPAQATPGRRARKKESPRE